MIKMEGLRKSSKISNFENEKNPDYRQETLWRFFTENFLDSNIPFQKSSLSESIEFMAPFKYFEQVI